jgi:hypothetical protein
MAPPPQTASKMLFNRSSMMPSSFFKIPVPIKRKLAFARMHRLAGTKRNVLPGQTAYDEATSASRDVTRTDCHIENPDE